ncbi:MAG: type II secretion system F family protein [Candidatus Diapherotrites archaeon]|nr:type II secretion system F family protein [Candidatus Diapherotrites archaeon]
MEIVYIILLVALITIPIGRDYLREQRRAKINEILPIALLELSTLPIHGLRDVADQLSHGYGPVSDVFKKAKRLIDRGIPPDRALRSAAEGTTALLEHAIQMIIAGYESGADWNRIIRKTAEDIEAVVDMDRQRRAGLALQRYNVLLSAGVFVPALLGISARMAAKVDPTVWNPISAAIRTSILPYIVILAVESAVFLALLDGRMKHALYYAAVLTGMGLTSYAIAMGM